MPEQEKPGRGKVIAIVGGGFTGATIAVQQIERYLAAAQNSSPPPLTLQIFDKSGRFGRGGPYSHDSELFLLN